jgi:hypothetical protein
MKSFCQSLLRRIGAGFLFCLIGFMTGALKPEGWNGWVLPAAAEGGQPNSAAADWMITVWVYNYANMGKKPLAQAEDDLHRILQKAGVEIKWKECPVTVEEAKTNMNCQERMPLLTLGLILRSKYADHPGGKNGANPFGSAELFAGSHDSRYVTLYAETISDPFYRHGLPEYQMLSIVAAHEFGHILLHSSTHSSVGLMQARLKQKDFAEASFGRLGFTPREAELIRAEIAARKNLEESQPAVQVAAAAEKK